MSLMTRRGLSMMATLVILVAACSGATPTQAPTSQPTNPPPTTSSLVSANGPSTKMRLSPEYLMRQPFELGDRGLPSARHDW